MALNASEFTDGAKPMPVILLLDISGSMRGEKISKLNSAVENMISALKNISAEQVAIKLSVITFDNNAHLHLPLDFVENVTWNKLSAAGGTNLAAALKMAKEIIEDRKVIPSRSYRPAVILVSDGRPNYGWEKSMNDFIDNGRSQKSDRMSMLIGDTSAASVMEQFLKGSGNRLFFANDANDIPVFFHYATMTTVSRAQSQNPEVTVSMPKYEARNTLTETVTDESDNAFVNMQQTIIMNNDEQEDE